LRGVLRRQRAGQECTVGEWNLQVPEMINLRIDDAERSCFHSSIGNLDHAQIAC
jgi:hypothetical protein